MPKLTWTGCDDLVSAAARVGPRVRALREARGLSQRDLAARARVSKNTLIRIERGDPIAEDGLTRICDSLQTILPNLLVSDDDWDRPYRIDRHDPSDYRIAFRRQSAPSIVKDFEPIPHPDERARLGRLNFVSGFVQPLDVTLRGGQIQAAIVELHGNQERPGYRHSGEEFVMVLSGRLRIQIGKYSEVLETGDSIGFQSKYRHRYESDLPLDATPPTRILMVWVEAEEDAVAITADEECDPHDAMV